MTAGGNADARMQSANSVLRGRDASHGQAASPQLYPHRRRPVRRIFIALLPGAAAYVLLLASARIYVLLDGRTFAGLPAVMLAWPWVDELPSAALPIGWILNATILGVGVSVVIAGFKFMLAAIRSRFLRGSPVAGVDDANEEENR